MPHKLISENVFHPTTPTDSTAGLDYILPASYRDDELSLHTPLSEISQFLLLDLSVQRLNKIDSYLWLAGRPMPPRPLNYQISVSREIILDEKADMHLVWGPNRHIHIKPLPRYLLDSNFWAAHIVCEEHGSASFSQQQPQSQLLAKRIPNHKTSDSGAVTVITCQKCDLTKSALGFLSSYIALMQYPSDFAIAKASNLLPDSLTWSTWRSLVQNLISTDSIRPSKINNRYNFGELRLSRLDKIYVFCRGHLLRGYRSRYQTYDELFQSYLTLITATTVYIALALTAMQVGLGTNRLAQNSAFQNASYGFTVFSILGPLLLLFLVILVAFAHLATNALATIFFKKERFLFLKKRSTVGA
ncbi:uncharacterized protein N7511_004440 [Penicillium nucicola]|uniref:uncharacterized protein n=1 Tax=Penicillium nucicola TaxID=1850975 RepID=UPI0025458845|nr:uncharacterized protein N7511_004440 [Penicillium nucicola]KAJ5766824.1 hypothetical protein N7511_004440 [Penicillium nucicola]